LEDSTPRPWRIRRFQVGDPQFGDCKPHDSDSSMTLVVLLEEQLPLADGPESGDGPPVSADIHGPNRAARRSGR
jgi:hypothetical protein